MVIVGVVPPTTISPLSSIVVELFCSVLPPVPSNRAIALSVAEPGPLASPVPRLETPSSRLSSVAEDVTNAPPSFSPFVPSCEATSKSIAPSDIVTSLSELMDIAGVVPTVEPSPMTRSSAESSRPT